MTRDSGDDTGDTARARDPESTPAVSAVGLTKVHRGGSSTVEVTALFQVSLVVKRATLTAITGPSGSGKSTLLHCLAGLDRPSSGHVYLAGVDLTQLNDRGLTRLRRDRVGFVFQAFNLIPTLNACENITLPLDIAGRKVDRSWLAELVEVLGIGPRLNHRPTQLSGGEQQRVAVARALIGRPDVVFADEPTGNLDSKTGNDLLALIANAVKEYGQTVVMVTHDASVASRASRVVFLMDGEVVDDVNDPTASSLHARMQELWDS
ncbi:MAG: ABC transporter ATP-binding protein [Acidimicrobiales bacterium]